jgi:hypothetical protein
VKLKALVGLIALGLAGASLAYAAPKAVSGNGNGNGPKTETSTTATTHGQKPPKTGEGVCRPRVSLVLKGTLNGVAGDKASLSVHVTGGSHLARKAYKGADVTVGVDNSTKFNRNGHKSIDDLVAGDRLVVQTRAVCKADYAPGGTLPSTLTAKRVTAHPAKT